MLKTGKNRSIPVQRKMQIETIERREFHISRQEAKEIISDSKIIAKIDGREYYLANMFPAVSDTYKVSFISYNPVEIELCWSELEEGAKRNGEKSYE